MPTFGSYWALLETILQFREKIQSTTHIIIMGAVRAMNKAAPETVVTQFASVIHWRRRWYRRA
jgi:hypothetical protein